MIYALQCGDKIKIGFSRWPPERLWNLQRENALPMTVLSITMGEQEDERRLHDYFSPYRQHAEWFSDTPEVRMVIASWTTNRTWLRDAQQAVARAYRKSGTSV